MQFNPTCRALANNSSEPCAINVQQDASAIKGDLNTILTPPNHLKISEIYVRIHKFYSTKEHQWQKFDPLSKQCHSQIEPVDWNHWVVNHFQCNLAPQKLGLLEKKANALTDWLTKTPPVQSKGSWAAFYVTSRGSTKSPITCIKVFTAVRVNHQFYWLLKVYKSLTLSTLLATL